MEKRRLRVLSYNIHKGFSMNNRVFILKDIRDAIRQVHPDLVFLQEVLGQHEVHRQNIEDWPTQPQFEFLAHDLWPHFAYGKNAVYTSGHHGNAILSKFPIAFSENIDVSTNRLESRGMLHAIIELPVPMHGKYWFLHAICVHLGLLEGERAKQIELLCQRIDSHVPHGEPLVIGGDFNDWRTRVSPTLERKLELREAFLELHGNHARTFPAWLPALRLDRVYYRGMDVRSARCMNDPPWKRLSDHAALMVELGL